MRSSIARIVLALSTLLLGLLILASVSAPFPARPFPAPPSDPPASPPFASLAAESAAANPSSSEPWLIPDPAALNRWQAMRFGMFIHWGPVSLTGQEIGWSRGAQTPVAEYDNLYTRFNPEKFNADEWVSAARAAGMKYIVLTTKPHDGFCLFDTKLTDFNIMKSPFKRDVTRELAEACKKQGIAFGVYHSVCDWHHPEFPSNQSGREGESRQVRHRGLSQVPARAGGGTD